MEEQRIILSEDTEPHPYLLRSGIRCLIDIRTEGHYYRTGRILDASCTFFTGNSWETWLLSCRADAEADEYELLVRFAELLGPQLSFMTFHGTSSCVPFLKKKYHLYGLPDPLEGKDHTDLSDMLYPLYFLLRLPSRRTEDYLGFPEHRTYGSPYAADADPLFFATALPRLTRFLSYTLLLSEPFECISTRSDNSAVYYELRPPYPLPRAVSYQAGAFYLTASDNRAVLSAALTDGKLRYYYRNYKDFAFLTEEGYAADKRIASLLPKERYAPCTRETAYTFALPGDTLLNDTHERQRYLDSAQEFIRGQIGM